MDTQPLTQLDVLHEPAGSDYQLFIEACSERCTTFSLVVQDGVRRAAEVDLCLRKLETAKLAEERVNEWPGTRLLQGSAVLMRYAVDANSTALLIDQADRLYAWQQPNLPEDLAFYYRDGGVALQTTAHEQDSVMFTDDAAWWIERFTFLHRTVAVVPD